MAVEKCVYCDELSFLKATYNSLHYTVDLFRGLLNALNGLFPC